jgi:hypothetical protein
MRISFHGPHSVKEYWINYTKIIIKSPTWYERMETGGWGDGEMGRGVVEMDVWLARVKRIL